MNSKDNNNLLSREEAWWFIPEEYCPIFLELEKEFNKQIDIRRQISELESKINDTPGYKRKPLKERLKNLNARRELFSRARIVEIVDILRYDRHFHYSDLADKRLNKKGRKDNTYQKFVRYADIMGDKSSTEKIVNRFIEYFKNLGILRGTENDGYYLEHYSNHIANYKVPFVTAQIIIECITSDLLSNRASRMMIFEAIHRLNQNPLVAIEIDDGESQEKALYDAYRKILTSGLEILRNNGFIRELKDNDIQYEFVYKREDELQQEICTHIEIRKKRNNERRVAALKKLAEIHANFHQTTSTSKEKDKAKLRRAQFEIAKKLSKLDQSSKNGRITYHWYNLILQYRNSVEFRKFKAFADDVLTYIRYQNIKNAITPVDKDSLYKWEKSYVIWDALGKFIQEEAKLNIISWPVSISDSEYRKAARNILKVIDDLIGNDSYKIVISPGQDESIVEQQKVRNDQIFSLFYVRAQVESSTMHSNATMHLEQLFNILAVENNKNFIDVCLIIDALHLLIARNTFEYSSKLKRWEFALNNIPDGQISFDIQITKISIYSLLLLVSSDECTHHKYQNVCASILNSLQAGNYEQKIEIIFQLTLFLQWGLNTLPYNEVITWLQNLYGKIDNIFKQGEGNDDPRLYVYKYETLTYASSFISRYLDFGYSLALLISHAYSHLQSLKIENDCANEILLDELSVLLNNLMPTYSLRIFITNQLNKGNNPLNYRFISEKLLESNHFELALKFANKAEHSYDCNNLRDIQEQTFYLDLLLVKVEILFNLGRETEAKALLLVCEEKIKQSEELYPQILRSRWLQLAVEHLERIKSTLETLPYAYRWIRLLSILRAIENMDSITEDVEIFFNKWDGFNGLDLKEDKSKPIELIEEFKSDLFPSVMEAVAHNVDFNTISIDTTPITEEEIKQLNKELQRLYIDEQRSFLCSTIDASEQLCADSEVILPSERMLFELLYPRHTAEAFVRKMNEISNRKTTDCQYSIENFEMLHFVAMSEWVSPENRLKACQLFMAEFDISTKSPYLREMAAEVLCQNSDLLECGEWDIEFDTQEVLLNQAESFIFDSNSQFISEKAIEIYISIERRLYDVYDYQGKSGLPNSLMVKNALDLIETHDIRSVDAARFLGERAEYFLYINDKQQAKTFLELAISILEELEPTTDDSKHYLDIYQGIYSMISLK